MGQIEDAIHLGKELIIIFKRYNKTKEHIKKFTDQKHYENYCRKMMQGGWKEIGTDIYKPKTMDIQQILDARAEPLDYTNDQKEALGLIQQFIADKTALFFLLVGNAGTGKTTIAENIARYAYASMMAPTNAAVKRLSDKFCSDEIPMERFRTIHQVLYGAPDPETGEFKPKEGLSPNSVWVVDEASMIDTKMLEDLLRDASLKEAKLIFVGDDFQLEPVGKDPKLFTWDAINEEFDPRWKIKLNEVKRNDGNILKVATHLRNAKGTEILNIDQQDFKIVKRFTSDLPLHIRDDDNYIVLCSTNKTRMEYNRHIRRARFEEDAREVVTNYERLISVANTRFLNGEQFTIKNPTIIEEHHESFNLGSWKFPKWQKFKIYLVQHEVVGITGLFKTVVIPELDKPSLHPMMLMSSQKIMHNPRMTEFIDALGKRFWRSDITIATYGYATSVHKSQGNEWDHVFIDGGWLSDAWNHSRWFYTAITRAKKDVQMLESFYFKKVDDETGS